MKRKLYHLLILCTTAGEAQEKMLTEEAFMTVVTQYHPVAKQAALDVRIADADITAARSPFDPVFKHYRAAKEFDATRYYDQEQTELRIPSWYGIDVYAGKEIITGSRINPEETKGALSYIGVSVPLAQNLVLDKRRAALRQAKVFRSFSEVQRRIIVNNLLRDALQTYWNWWEAFQNNQLMKTALANAEKRFEMVRAAYRLGERPAIDTLEALTQIQTFSIRQNEVYTGLLKTYLELSTFLWTQNGVQYDLPVDVAPQAWGFEKVLPLDAILTAAAAHPELTQYNFKLEAQRIEKTLMFQSLLPEINLNYQQIGYRFSQAVKGVPFQADYRFGVSLQVPLRLSEGRGAYRKASLKFDQIKLEQANKQAQVLNKIKQQYVAWQQLSTQVSLQSSMVANVAALQRGEETRFFNGESSLFLINARELRTIEAQQKLIELQSKTRSALIDVMWSAGLLSN